MCITSEGRERKRQWGKTAGYVCKCVRVRKGRKGPEKGEKIILKERERKLEEGTKRKEGKTRGHVRRKRRPARRRREEGDREGKKKWKKKVPAKD